MFHSSTSYAICRLVAINGVWLDRKATLRGIIRAVEALSKSNSTMRHVCVQILRPKYNRESASSALCANDCHAIICYWTHLMHLHTDITSIKSAKLKKIKISVIKPEATPDADEAQTPDPRVPTHKLIAASENDRTPAELPPLPETVYSEAEVEEMRRRVKHIRNYVLGYERAMKEHAEHYKSELVALMEQMTK